jgi:hypothetical protein
MWFEALAEQAGGPAGSSPYVQPSPMPFAEGKASMHVISSGKYARQLSQSPDFAKTEVA